MARTRELAIGCAMDILSTLLICLVCLLLEGFFSGSEIGVVSADQMKLRLNSAKGSKGAKLALEMLQRPEWLLSTTLVGTNISVVTNTTMITALMIHLFGEHGSLLAVGLAAPLIWIFGEIVPKSVFQQRADVLTPHVIFVLRFFSYLFYPILLFFTLLTRLLAKLAGGIEGNPFTLREEILTMLCLHTAARGDIEPGEKEMIRRSFNFTETLVRDAMCPLIDVTAVERQATCGEARRLASEAAHIRLPVYEERVDRVAGMLNVLDLLGEADERPISDFVRETHYVPSSKSIRDLLLYLRTTGEVVAVVVDEFGAAEGIVTVEDIVEEVVEDLHDEYDTPETSEELFQKLGERDYLTSGRTELTPLAEGLGVELPAGGYSTLAGFILHKTGSIPPQGTRIEEGRYTLIVHRGTARAVEEVRICWTD
ncbi:MAG: hemolysin family protein [Gammaproteobacteria bacterium]|jgi:CBS domain containing-hemolysin-like protein|nr:hemolysin family protein [Gammaproteobacteria bacterium]